MHSNNIDIQEFHWIMDIIRSIDVGLVVLDRDYRIRVWNNFMENHSGWRPDRVLNNNIFKIFPEIPQDWLIRKAESVFQLKNRAFTTWEQRPYLFKFKNYRPITGSAEYMYQNITLIPLVSANKEVNHVGIIIYDVTDVAVSKIELEEANEQLEGLSRTDRLTQLFNRGYWEECLSLEFTRFKRTHHTSSLIMFDIDHFKKINDSYGHQAGDEVIRQTADAFRHTLRSSDIAGRYGGEEFSAILIDTSAKDALVFAERLRKRIEATNVHYEQHDIRFTISLGVAEISNDMSDYQQWLECSDQALYSSKHNGRNQTTIFRKILATNK